VFTLGMSGLAVLVAFLAAGLLLWGYGINPWRFYALMVQSTLGDSRGWAEVARKATPLMLIGVGLVVAFRAQFWNIGAEGQLLAGAVAATGVALFVPLRAPALLLAMFLAGSSAGALWGALPALLKLRLQVNEVITTLMMNYLALHLVQWLIHGPWKGQSALGFAYTDTLPFKAWLPLLPGTRVHWPTLLLGLLLAILAAFLLFRLRLGYEIRVLGQSPAAARYAGIDVPRVTLWVVLCSGGAAGLAGVGEVAGIHHKLLDPTQVSLGYGYTAIIVAWLARGQPLMVIPTALFMGGIFASGDTLKVTLQVPFQVVEVMNGLILLCLVGSERLVQAHWQPREAS
jgi:simple sugar transport system permease protein